MSRQELIEAVGKYIEEYYILEQDEVEIGKLCDARCYEVEDKLLGSLDDFMNQMEETFSQRLLRMIDDRGMSDSEAYTKAFVDRRHFSKIRKNIFYSPNKKTVLAFCIALELSLDEAKDLLSSAGFAFSRSSKTDIIVTYFIENKIYDMFEINDVLEAYGQKIFG